MYIYIVKYGRRQCNYQTNLIRCNLALELSKHAQIKTHLHFIKQTKSKPIHTRAHRHPILGRSDKCLLYGCAHSIFQCKRQPIAFAS